MEIAEKINMQLYNRLVKIEKENQKLKRAMQDVKWLTDIVERIRTITEVIGFGNETKGIEQRPTDI